MDTSAEPARPEIAAAGGIPWRYEGDQLLLAVVHRPRYDDWSFPKGKLEVGETPLLAAVREVGEETGLTVRVGRRLSSQTYRSGEADKVVDYWSMAVDQAGGDFAAGDSGGFAVNGEVDALDWLSPEDAVRRLSYDDDAGLVVDLQSRPLCPVRLLLVRHAKAGVSESWEGHDEDRPLDAEGRLEAADVAALLGLFTPRQLFVGGPLRCWQTLGPTAEAMALPLQALPALSAEGYFAAPQAARDAVRALLRTEGADVVVSQGGVIAELVAWLCRDDAPLTGVSPRRRQELPPERKGSVWAVSADDDGTVVGADYYPPQR
ncbi:MAG: NUDIX hydrolase [Geodermatophilaceae bacterium]|nr:NUDIX hydrolase [Geodermatophilaceae bacterium]